MEFTYWYLFPIAIVIATVANVGGQMGPLLSQRIQGQRLVRFLGWLFLVVTAITLSEALLGG